MPRPKATPFRIPKRPGRALLAPLLVAAVLAGASPAQAADASFSWSPQVPQRNEPTSFTAADALAVSYAWDFGADGSVESTFPTATFSSAASYSVRLTVTDLTGSDTKQQDVRVNQPPVADFTFSPAAPETGQRIDFDARPSSDPDGGDLDYAWDVDGDPEFEFSGDPTIDFSYATPGPKTVRLRVSDSDGGVDTVSKGFTVTAPPQPPVAAFSFLPAQPLAGVPVQFDATATTDDEPIAEAGFDWEVHDGVEDFADMSGRRPTFTFQVPGQKRVTLRVTDADGLQNTVTKTFTVIAPNRNPTADFHWTPAPPRPRQEVDFQSDSTDPDGDPLTLAWELDGDDDFNDAPRRTYPRAGRYEAKLLVSDGRGGLDLEVKTVVVDNRVPSSSFEFSPRDPLSGVAVSFRSTSSDPDGDELKHDWDLDNDGQFDDADGETARRAFSAPGVHTVGLRVRDEDGSQASFKQVRVGNRLPLADFTRSLADPTVGDRIGFTSVSGDPDGQVASHAWDFDGDGRYDDGAGKSASWTFPAAGEHTVRLRVVDTHGGADVEAKQVFVRRAGQLGRIDADIRSRILAGRRMSRIAVLTINAPGGAAVRVTICRSERCKSRAAGVKKRGSLLRLRWLERRFRKGTVIGFYVTKAGAIGEYTAIKIRGRNGPARRERCLMPANLNKPVKCG